MLISGKPHPLRSSSHKVPLTQHPSAETVWEEIGKGRLLKDALDDLKKSGRGEPEGPETVKLIYELSRQLKIRMPLTEACYNVLFSKKSPERGIKEFLES